MAVGLYLQNSSCQVLQPEKGQGAASSYRRLLHLLLGRQSCLQVHVEGICFLKCFALSLARRTQHWGCSARGSLCNAALLREGPVLPPACPRPSVLTIPKATLACAEMLQFVP